MSGKNIALLVGAVAVIGGGVWWIGFSGGVDTSEVVTNSGASTGSGSFAMLAARGESLECDFAIEDEEMSGSGVGYFANGQMRIDATYQIEGSTYTSSYIVVEPDMFVWGDMPDGSFAMRMSTDQSDMTEVDMEMDGEVTGAEAISIDDEVTYECRRWRADSRMFTPPADIDFMDMNALMEGMMPTGVQLDAMMEGMSQAEMEVMMQQMEDMGMMWQ